MRSSSEWSLPLVIGLCVVAFSRATWVPLARCRHTAFRSNTGGQLDNIVRADERVVALLQCRGLPPAYTTPLVYPRLYSLNDLQSSVRHARGGGVWGCLASCCLLTQLLLCRALARSSHRLWRWGQGCKPLAHSQSWEVLAPVGELALARASTR